MKNLETMSTLELRMLCLRCKLEDRMKVIARSLGTTLEVDLDVDRLVIRTEEFSLTLGYECEIYVYLSDTMGSLNRYNQTNLARIRWASGIRVTGEARASLPKISSIVNLRLIHNLLTRLDITDEGDVMTSLNNAAWQLFYDKLQTTNKILGVEDGWGFEDIFVDDSVFTESDYGLKSIHPIYHQTLRKLGLKVEGNSIGANDAWRWFTRKSTISMCQNDILKNNLLNDLFKAELS